MKKSLVLAVGLGAGCATYVLSAATPAASVDPARLLQHIKVLASDEFEGRLPGTAGEDKSVAYITEQFRQLGLAPGNPDGTYLQEVPLEGITGTPTMSLTSGGQPITMQRGQDFV